MAVGSLVCRADSSSDTVHVRPRTTWDAADYDDDKPYWFTISAGARAIAPQARIAILVERGGLIERPCAPYVVELREGDWGGASPDSPDSPHPAGQLTELVKAVDSTVSNEELLSLAKLIQAGRIDEGNGAAIRVLANSGGSIHEQQIATALAVHPNP